MAATLARAADSRLGLCHAPPWQLIWVLPAVLALVDWYAVARGDRRTETWAKPAVLVALIVDRPGPRRDRHRAPGSGCWSALVLGLAGDVFLLGDSDTRFRLGLAAFLVGHLALRRLLRAGSGSTRRSWAWVAWLVLLVCLPVATRQVAPATYLRGGRRSPCRSRSTRW